MTAVAYSRAVNVQYLIDSVVRQTTVLIAQLATTGGARAPLAHVANQVFLDLAQELESQGVGRKVGADMFGLALRSYQRKIQRISESSTFRGRSLWEAVFDYLGEHDVVTRRELDARFRYDDEALLRGVLHDLTESGLVFRAGSGLGAAYRRASDDELGRLGEEEDREGTDALLWARIYRSGPISREALLSLGSPRPDQLDAALRRLVDGGSVERFEQSGEALYRSDTFLVALGASAGWEAAVFDHFQALVTTICRKLAEMGEPASMGDVTGGSTYTFDVWPGHPHRDEVLGLLAELRARLGALRGKVEGYNAEAGLPAEFEQVVVYAGQVVVPEQEGSEVDAS